ncbi:unnamed protein product, partial [Prorocentrum cordatum]
EVRAADGAVADRLVRGVHQGCCYSCCTAGRQRSDISEVLGEPHVCRDGMFPCGPPWRAAGSELHVGEAFCCHGCATCASRLLLQTRPDRQSACRCDGVLFLPCASPPGPCASFSLRGA